MRAAEYDAKEGQIAAEAISPERSLPITWVSHRAANPAGVGSNPAPATVDDEGLADALAANLSFANTSSDCLGNIGEPRAKGVSRVRCRTFGILRRPIGRDPGGFRGSSESRQIARDRTRPRWSRGRRFSTMRLGGRSGGAGRRLREAARSCLSRGARSVEGRVRPCRARGGSAPDGNRRYSG